MSPDVVARMIAEHPEVRLPCPRCAASVRARNLGDHLARQHPGTSTAPGSAWSGSRGGPLRGRLALEGNRLVLRRPLRRLRAVELPAAAQLGGAQISRPVGTVSASSDASIATEMFGAGVYLRIGGRRAIVVRCTHGTGARKHWTGWSAGPARRRWHVTVAPADFVAIQYVLVDHGVLTLR